MSVVLIGSGLIARSWATIFARGGYSVHVYNVDREKMEEAVKDISQVRLQRMEKEGLLGEGKSAQELAKLVHVVEDLAQVLKTATLVQECVPESLQVKAQVWNDLDDVLAGIEYPEDLVLASSSSNILMAKFCSELKCKANCVNAHPLNPPSAIPVVELIPAPFTKPEILQKVRTIMEEVGMSPVTLKKEVDGFIVNRLQYALLAEAMRLVQSGICSPEDVDTAVTDGLARRWVFIGPFATIDLNAPKGVEDYCARYSQAVYDVVAQQDNAVVWTDETIKTVHEAMRNVNGPLESLPARAAWRDRRLNHLQKHLDEENKFDQNDN